MKTSITIPGLVIFLLLAIPSMAQILNLEQVKDSIRQAHPSLRMYDAEGRSMDAAAKGSWSWMPPEIGTGLFMMPYNPKFTRKTEMGDGMGQYVIGIEQMFPNRKRQSAEYRYMSTMSSVVKEKKQAALNELIADAKKNYFEWVVIKMKFGVLDQNEKLLEFMIKNAEIRYKNGLGKLSAYYKAKAALGNIQNMRLMLENDIRLLRINLNTLMNRDKEINFDIDTIFSINDYTNNQLDSTTFIKSRSDVRAIERDIQLVGLEQQLEQAKLFPEFGFRYEHMFGLGGQPAQYTLMAIVRLSFTSWASRMSKANIESLRWRRESLRFERQMVINELSGMASNMRTEFNTKRKQLKLYEENIIPALQNNYNTMQLSYEQNTEELFELYDAWETLNMTQLEYLDQLQQLLIIQVELERILEIK
ncbi:MAG: TolC family protein [Bacteroidota bacterium]|nr:TolC family protein [Bacteroidota bacterium]